MGPRLEGIASNADREKIIPISASAGNRNGGRVATVNTDTSLLLEAAWKRVKKSFPLAVAVKHEFELLMWPLEVAGKPVRERDLAEHAETLCLNVDDVKKAIQLLVREGFWIIEQGCIRSISVLDQIAGFTKRSKNLKQNKKPSDSASESATDSVPRQEQYSIEQNSKGSDSTEPPVARPRLVAVETLPDDADEYQKLAWDFLEHPDGTKPFEKRGEFLSDGRRPMKKYPMLWFKPQDLAEVLRDFDGTIGRDNIRLLFQSLKARVESHQQHKREPWKLSPFAWATGFARTETLRSVQAEISLAATKQRTAK